MASSVPVATWGHAPVPRSSSARWDHAPVLGLALQGLPVAVACPSCAPLNFCGGATGASGVPQSEGLHHGVGTTPEEREVLDGALPRRGRLPRQLTGPQSSHLVRQSLGYGQGALYRNSWGLERREQRMGGAAHGTRYGCRREHLLLPRYVPCVDAGGCSGMRRAESNSGQERWAACLHGRFEDSNPKRGAIAQIF